MMSTDYLTIVDAGVALRRGDVSAQELIARALSRVDPLDEVIGVFHQPLHRERYGSRPRRRH